MLVFKHLLATLTLLCLLDLFKDFTDDYDYDDDDDDDDDDDVHLLTLNYLIYFICTFY